MKLQEYVARLCGLLTVFTAWQWLSFHLSPMILVSVQEATSQLVALLGKQVFWQSLSVSLLRLGLALCLAIALGFSLGVLSGRFVWLKHYLEPLRWVLMSVPPVVVVLLAMLWFGLGDTMVVFIVVLLLSPTIYVNIQKGVEQIDPKWLELAEVYAFSTVQKLTCIYIPAISAPLCSAMVAVCCSGVRILVLAEVLGADQGIGFELANARGHFDMADLYAWVLVTLGLVALLEFLLLRPLQQYLLRWRQ